MVEEEELGMGNVLSDDDIKAMFMNQSEGEDTEEEKTDEDLEEEEIKQIFENKSQEEDDSPKRNNAERSSSKNVFSSLAKALYAEGYFPDDIPQQSIEDCSNAEEFKELIDGIINYKFDVKEQELMEAKKAGVDISELDSIQNKIDAYSSITEEKLNSSNERVKQVIDQIILTNFQMKGYSQDKALRKLNQYKKSGTEIEEAMDAKEEMLEFLYQQKQKLVNEAKYKKQQEEDSKLMSRRRLDAILKGNTFDSLNLDGRTKNKIIKNVYEPVTEDGLNAVEVYAKQNPELYKAYVGAFYTLTNGFKNLNFMNEKAVNKEVKKGLASLENLLSQNEPSMDGLKFANNSAKDIKDLDFEFDI